MKYFASVALAILCFGLFVYARTSTPTIINNTYQAEQEEVGATSKNVTLMSMVATTSTSSPINIAGAKRVSLIFSRDVHATGSTTFAVYVSPDGTNYVAYNKLIDNVANTNAQTLTRVSNKVLSATGTAMLSMDLENDFISKMYVVATRAITGTSSAYATVEY